MITYRKSQSPDILGFLKNPSILSLFNVKSSKLSNKTGWDWSCIHFDLFLYPFPLSYLTSHQGRVANQKNFRYYNNKIREGHIKV